MEEEWEEAPLTFSNTTSKEWRNIQDVVKQSFAQVFEVIKSQQAVLSTLEASVGSKASHREVKNLASKVEGDEFAVAETMTSQVSTLTDRLASVEAEKAALEAQVRAQGQALERQSGTMNALQSTVERLSGSLGELTGSVGSKASNAAMESELSSLRKAFAEQEERLAAAGLGRSGGLAEGKENSAGLAPSLLAALKRKADSAMMEEALASKASASEVASTLDQVIASMEVLKEEIGKKAGLADVQGWVRAKADIAEVEAALASKAGLEEVSAALNTKASKQAVMTALHKKANKVDVESALDGKASIGDVNSVLVKKADAESVLSGLSGKANRSEVADLVQGEISTALAPILTELETCARKKDLTSKVDNKALTAALADKVDGSHVVDTVVAATTRLETTLEGTIRDLRAQMDLKLGKGELAKTTGRLVTRKELQEALKENASSNSVAVKRLKDSLSVFAEKTALEEVAANAKLKLDSRMTALSARLDSVEKRDPSVSPALSAALETRDAALSARLEERISTAVSALDRDWSGKLSEMKVALGKRTTAEDFRRVIEELAGKFEEELRDTSGELRAAMERVEGDSERRTSKLGADVSGAVESVSRMGGRLDGVEGGLAELRTRLSSAEAAVASKAERADMLSGLEGLANRVDLESGLRGKADVSALDSLARVEDVEELRRAVGLRAEMRDVMVLMDTKAGAEEVAQALERLGQVVDSKASTESVDAFVEEQRGLNEALSGEVGIGRWLWKSRKLKGGHGVPWNVEHVNTIPSVFGWEKDKVNLTVRAGGLYEITFGFYGNPRSVQLLVNGEPVLATVAKSAYAVEPESGCMTPVDRGGSSGVAGLTLNEFVALPAGARLAVSFNGEPGHAKGFFGLRRLA